MNEKEFRKLLDRWFKKNVFLTKSQYETLRDFKERDAESR